MNKVTHIMFDLFNTLYRFDPERETTQINAAKLIGIEITNAKIVSALNKADKWFAKKTSEISLHLMNDKEKDLFYSNYEKILFNYAGYEISDKDSKIIWDYVKNMKSSLKLFEDAKNLLNVLKDKKISTAIVTNFDSDGKSLSKSLGIPDLVDFVITSKDAEAPKPSNKIFDYALNYINAKPENCIFIGDQIETDILGAKRANIMPLLIDRDSINADYKDCIVISDLMETLNHINLKSN